MACGKTLISVFVIPGDARHQLLCVGVAKLRHFREELLSSRAPQRGGKCTTVQDLNFTGFPRTEAKA